MFGNICRMSPENGVLQIAKRQMAMRIENRFSWFNLISDLGAKYDIDVFKNLFHSKEKREWKREVKTNVDKYWITSLTEESAQKSSLKWYIPNNTPNAVHPVWKPCEGDPRKIEDAGTRACMLVGSFKTQSMTAKFNGEEDKRCKVCNTEEEDILHLMVKCGPL